MRFGHSFTQQQRFGGLKMQSFKTGLKMHVGNKSTVFESLNMCI